jgi:hypothetical protein
VEVAISKHNVEPSKEEVITSKEALEVVILKHVVDPSKE